MFKITSKRFYSKSENTQQYKETINSENLWKKILYFKRSSDPVEKYMTKIRTSSLCGAISKLK